MSSTTTPSPNWSVRAKWIVSGLVIFQFLAVIAEPFHFFTHSPARGSSHAARPLRQILAPYVELAYLNHGYFFFAPEPGPSHLLQCSLTMPDGTTPTLRYPDKYTQWPRLLYHRHFMLAEHFNQLYVPPVDEVAAKEMSPEELADWKVGRNRFEVVRRSMENHLKVRYAADSASIERIRHNLPGEREVLEQHTPLNDPRFYVVLPDALLGNDPSSNLRPPLAYPSRAGAEKIEAAP